MVFSCMLFFFLPLQYIAALRFLHRGLCDVVSFLNMCVCMISAVLFFHEAYVLSQHPWPRIGWGCAHFIAACQRIFLSRHRMGGVEEDRCVRVGRRERKKERKSEWLRNKGVAWSTETFKRGGLIYIKAFAFYFQQASGEIIHLFLTRKATPVRLWASPPIKDDRLDYIA